jgi:hypothetical protein
MKRALEFGKSRFSFKAAPRRSRDLVVGRSNGRREQIGCGVGAQPPLPCQIEDRGLRGTELVDERGHAAGHHLQQAKRHDRAALLRVEKSHGQAAHRHEHRIDLALADGAARQIADHAAEQRSVDVMIVQVDEARHGDTAGNGDRVSILGRIARQIGDPAILYDDRMAL